ncbi:MAG: sigma-54 dependent transcriptional regulator [Desulfatiglans sp.]|jgi:DNA-binding NtrC family response regulator|nr:sigma-54 dependent transcriptional regulator [Thermodesulfobacteriota bacterium]MEE4354069.1 sigma-54 dependent transcriptional regulator [Desulfatiglans sp.]
MKRTINILIIDDDQFLTESLSDFLMIKGYGIQTADSGRDGIKTFERQQPCLVLLDQKLPDMMGIDVCRRILEINPNTKIIFITAYATVEYAVEAMRVGAFNYLSKPFELDELLIAIDMAIKNVQLEGKVRVQEYEQEKERREKRLIGSSEVMARIMEQVKLAASSDANVLITGETGVGKNVVAKAIHDVHDKRETFLTINCSAIPENLMESEYFGHEKGVFTGADRRREGIFELADGGTLVLDEIGEIPIHLQSKFLTVLEDKCIRRIGSRRTIPVDVRIIATTNQDLEKAIQKKQFRQDLYYRLAVFNMHIPPLRQHSDDICEIAQHFAAQFLRKPVKIPKSHIKKMKEYSWPGNVRELRNVIERASLFFEDDEIRPGDLLIQNSLHLPLGNHGEDDHEVEEITPLEEVKRRHIMSALDAYQGNKTQTAKALGVSLSTLKRKLREMKIG